MGASSYQRCRDVGCTSKRCMEHWYIKGNDTRTNTNTRGALSRFAGLWSREMKSDQQPQNQTEVSKLVAMVASCLARGEDPQKVGVNVRASRTMGDIFDGYLAFRRLDAKLHGTTFNESGAHNTAVSSARRTFGALAPDEMTEAKIQGFILGFVDRGVKAATPNQYLRLFTSQACAWAAAQRPPLMVNPFGKFGYRIEAMSDSRDTRCEPHIEARLLKGCAEMGVPWLADIITIMIDLACREGEPLMMVNGRIDWKRHMLTFADTKRKRRGGTGKGENRTVPFNPAGRVAAILNRRRFAGPDAYVIALPGESALKKTRVTVLYRAWCNLLLHVLCDTPRTSGMQVVKGTPEWQKLTALNLNLHDLRHEGITWWGLREVPKETRDWLTGHMSQFGMDGRYDHSKEQVAVKHLREKVWPVEYLRASASQFSPIAAGKA